MIGPWGRPRGVRVAPKTLPQIRERAVRAREMLGISEHPIDLVDLLENRLRAIGIHFHIVDAVTIPGEAARAIPDQDLLLVTKDAYDGVHLGDPEYTLLVPHEFGHFALRHAVTFARSKSQLLHGPTEDSEIQADQFSHEFVMPPTLVRRHCGNAEDIQRSFRVPLKDARIRDYVLRCEGFLG